MDETYIKVKGQWYSLYRAVAKTGQTIDFLLTEHRDEEAALDLAACQWTHVGSAISPPFIWLLRPIE